ncbi:MAG: aldo/keto reductase, partial [Gemmatimonadaceae bacterium]|nr:aldo/keto reductase [Gemmatimonadaceae bacterium]
LWSRDVEAEILPAVRRLGIGFVAYSPLGRGFLSGAIRSRADLQPGDWRLENPRFSEDAVSAARTPSLRDSQLSRGSRVHVGHRRDLEEASSELACQRRDRRAVQ